MSLANLLFKIVRVTMTLVVIASLVGLSGGNAWSASAAEGAPHSAMSAGSASFMTADVVKIADCGSDYENEHSEHNTGAACCIGMCVVSTIIAEQGFPVFDAPRAYFTLLYSGLIAENRIFGMMRPPSQLI